MAVVDRYTFILIILVFIVFMSIASDVAEQNKILTRKYLAAFTNKDIASLEELIHPKYSVSKRTRETFANIQEELPYFKADTTNEVISVIERVKMLHSGFSEFNIIIIKMIAAGGQVWVDADVEGVHSGNIFGIQPTYKKIKYRAHYRYEIKDGKIIEADWLYDNLNLLKQLGRSILLENNKERVSEYLSVLTKMGLLGNVTS